MEADILYGTPYAQVDDALRPVFLTWQSGSVHHAALPLQYMYGFAWAVFWAVWLAQTSPATAS